MSRFDRVRETKAIKLEEAKARQEEHDKLTPQEKLAKLDERLGEGIGAKRERARLQAELAKEKKK